MITINDSAVPLEVAPTRLAAGPVARAPALDGYEEGLRPGCVWLSQVSAPLPLEMLRWSMHSYGAMFCELPVNAITGEPRILRFLGSFDSGRIIDPKTAASQFRGGIIMGLGLALMEEAQFDERNGRIMTQASLSSTCRCCIPQRSSC
jgi:CO/xanthine dehydrogenase Mo-binding subunit